MELWSFVISLLSKQNGQDLKLLLDNLKMELI